MPSKNKNSEKIIFSSEHNEEVEKFRKSWDEYALLVIAWVVSVTIMILTPFNPIQYPGIMATAVGIGVTLLILIINGNIQLVRIMERGIYPPTRGILNIFLMRERFIPFSKIKEFRIYNPSLEKFPEYWAKMSKREREDREILESEYDIVLKNGKVIKMFNWATALYLSKNFSSVRELREFRDILLKINEELKKGKTIIRKEDIFGNTQQDLSKRR